MALKKFLLRLAGIGGSKDRKVKSKGKQKASDHVSVIVHHADSRPIKHADDAHAITKDDMESSANNQDFSMFFSRLPLELRRQIYREVWRGYLESTCRLMPLPVKSRMSSSSMPMPAPPATPLLFRSDLGLHIYTDGSGGTKLGHTVCRVHDCPPDQGEQNRLSIQPWMYEEGSRPPMWLWRAWVMRQHWNRHWKCQSAVMKRWNPETGGVQEIEMAPFLPLFLTCKKMYWEAVSSFFENVTPIFTSSKDVHRFFVLNPHPFAKQIRTLELNFTDQNDHLFLQEIQRPDTVETAGDDAPAGNTAADASIPGDGISDGEPGASEDPATAHDHQCSTPRCCLDLFGQQLLDQILSAVQTQVPHLKDLVITITGRMEHSHVLDRFSYISDDENKTETELMKDETEVVEVAPFSNKWELSGNLTINFEAEGVRYHVRKGGKLVRRRLD